MRTRLAVLASLGALCLPTLTPSRAVGQEATPIPKKTVNVEFILDASGSMAETTDTGETRMDAAKRVLAGVVEAIPERKEINVGFRLYGYEGDNSWEAPSPSRSVRGIDRRATTAVGWLTPDRR